MDPIVHLRVRLDHPRVLDREEVRYGDIPGEVAVCPRELDDGNTRLEDHFVQDEAREPIVLFDLTVSGVYK